MRARLLKQGSPPLQVRELLELFTNIWDTHEELFTHYLVSPRQETHSGPVQLVLSQSLSTLGKRVSDPNPGSQESEDKTTT